MMMTAGRVCQEGFIWAVLGTRVPCEGMHMQEHLVANMKQVATPLGCLLS